MRPVSLLQWSVVDQIGAYHPLARVEKLSQSFPVSRRLSLLLLDSQGSRADRPTVDPRLTDGTTYRLFELQTSLGIKFRFDLQPENRPTDWEKKPKMEQKWPVTA